MSYTPTNADESSRDPRLDNNKWTESDGQAFTNNSLIPEEQIVVH